MLGSPLLICFDMCGLAMIISENTPERTSNGDVVYIFLK